MIMQNNIQERFVNPNSVAVFDKAELAKAVHEEADPGPRCPDHLRQGLLRDLWNQRVCLAESCHQEENTCQTFFTRVKELIDKIGLGSHAPVEQELQKQVGELMLLMHYADHLFSPNLERSTVVDRGGGG